MSVSRLGLPSKRRARSLSPVELCCASCRGSLPSCRLRAVACFLLLSDVALSIWHGTAIVPRPPFQKVFPGDRQEWWGWHFLQAELPGKPPGTLVLCGNPTGQSLVTRGRYSIKYFNWKTSGWFPKWPSGAIIVAQHTLNHTHHTQKKSFMLNAVRE